MTTEQPTAEQVAAPGERLATVGADLAAAVERELPGWVARVLADHAGSVRLDDAVVVDTAAAVLAAVVAPLRSSLTRDVDRPGPSPLAVVRAGVGPVNAALAAAGVAPRRRDDHQVALFPDDLYDVVPASFAELGAEAGALAVEWGAVRAYVHLARRRADTQDPTA